MKKQVYINGQDAYTTWGITLAHGAVDALMTPPPSKDVVTGAYRREHGTRWVDANHYMDERDLTIEMHIHGDSYDDLHTKYLAFCEDVLQGVAVAIVTKWQPAVCYRLRYISCTSFSHVQGLAKFALKLNEPDPSDRDLPDDYTLDW